MTASKAGESNDSPRVSAIVIKHVEARTEGTWELLELARTLERELATANARAAEAEEWRKKWKSLADANQVAVDMLTKRTEATELDAGRLREDVTEAKNILQAMEDEYNMDQECDYTRINCLIERGSVFNSDGAKTAKAYWACWGDGQTPTENDRKEYADYIKRAMQRRQAAIDAALRRSAP